MVTTTEARRKRTLAQRLNEFIDMVVEHGRSSEFRLGQFTESELRDFEATGMRAEEQRRLREAVPSRVMRKDITADSLEATLDLAEGLESGKPGLERWIMQGRRARRA